jgi:phosphoglycerate dehydrogenase-like enzyme
MRSRNPSGGRFIAVVAVEGVIVTTGSGAAAILVAEYVMAAILVFEKASAGLPGNPSRGLGQRAFGSIYGKKVGITGFGSIGRAVADRAFAFGMSVTALRS